MHSWLQTSLSIVWFPADSSLRPIFDSFRIWYATDVNWQKGLCTFHHSQSKTGWYLFGCVCQDSICHYQPHLRKQRSFWCCSLSQQKNQNSSKKVYGCCRWIHVSRTGWNASDYSLSHGESAVLQSKSRILNSGNLPRSIFTSWNLLCRCRVSMLILQSVSLKKLVWICPCFPHQSNLCSCASLTPQNNESAGKRKPPKSAEPVPILSRFWSSVTWPFARITSILKSRTVSLH